MSSTSPDAISAELQAISSKRASFKDKLKRRREALGSILTQSGISADIAGSASSTASSNGKTKEEKKSGEKKDAEVLDPIADLLGDVKKDKSEGEVSKESSDAKDKCGKTKPKEGKSPSQPPPEKRSKSIKTSEKDDIQSLLSMQSAKEKQDQKQREEIQELLSQPTAKEKNLMDAFRSQSGGGVKEFCHHSTKGECMKANQAAKPCIKLHFAKIIQPHTDEALGDCSFLNTCFHMDTCKYIHYEVDADDLRSNNRGKGKVTVSSAVISRHLLETVKLVPPQWVQCDLRNFQLDVLGKFSVVMADPPWDIHMELPYGTMSDDEMRQLPVPNLQDDGLIFLWVTGRAMELGRECLKLWGYERVDELIWVKTNQLQRIIRTGRTGHWLNHGKEHCLVGMKGSLKLNRGLDSDVIVAEVRATSHKPDEIYGIIERMSPGTRKIELFGRPHNVQPNWVTLGNQLDGVVIHDEAMLNRWNKAYPDGYELVKNFVLKARQVP